MNSATLTRASTNTYRMVTRATGVSAAHYRVPSHIILLGQIAPGWILNRQLVVKLERDNDGTAVASDDLFLVYGTGSTFAEALQDYVVSLIEYYELLAARPISRQTKGLFNLKMSH